MSEHAGLVHRRQILTYPVVAPSPPTPTTTNTSSPLFSYFSPARLSHACSQMSGFAEHLVDMAWGYGGGTIQGLKALSRSLVEDDDDILMLLVLLGIPTLLVVWAISRCIDRAHSRVRYASEYRAVDSNDYATSSSSSSDGSRSSDDDVGDNAIHQGNRRSWYRPTMDEVARAAQQLTEQETTRHRRSRRLAARYGHGGDASAQAAPDGETAGKD